MTLDESITGNLFKVYENCVNVVRAMYKNPCVTNSTEDEMLKIVMALLAGILITRMSADA